MPGFRPRIRPQDSNPVFSSMRIQSGCQAFSREDPYQKLKSDKKVSNVSRIYGTGNRTDDDITEQGHQQHRLKGQKVRIR